MVINIYDGKCIRYIDIILKLIIEFLIGGLMHIDLLSFSVYNIIREIKFDDLHSVVVFSN